MRPRRLVALVLVFAVATVPVASHAGLAATSPGAGDGTGAAPATAATGTDYPSTIGVLPSKPTVPVSDGPSSGNDALAADPATERIVLGAENTTNYLGFETDDVEREDHARSSLDVVGAVEQDAAALESEYASLSFEYAHRNASGENVSAAIRAEFDRLDGRVAALRDRHERAIQRYNDGDWSTDRFLRELATIDENARGIEDRLERIDRVTGPAPPVDVTDRSKRVRAELLPLYGTVQAQIGAAISGERDPFVTYAVTSADGVVVAASQDDVYYRDAYLGSEFANNGTNRFAGDGNANAVSAALDRATSLYPWAYGHGTQSIDAVSENVYTVGFDHEHGELEASLDGATTDVFRESQQKPLQRLPVESTVSIGDGLRVAVNATHGTGPLQVTVTDAETGEPIRANVTIDGSQVGRTGADGSLWTIASQGSIRLTIETKDGRSLRRNYVIG